MPFQNDKVGDVIAVLAIMRNKYRNESSDRMVTKLRKDAVKSVAETELQSNRFMNFVSARETINDAFARRLQPDITDRKTFDELAGQWLRNNSMRLKDILLKHSTNHSQRAEVNKFFADENLPDDAQSIEKPRVLTGAQSIIPEEIAESTHFYEGAVRSISINIYERSTVAREKCILHYGCKCSVCNAVLSDIYGEIAQGYIHVHHLRQLSEINERYQVDPIEDLRPVCPNCHVIIHTSNPPYTIEQVKGFIEKHKNANKTVQ